MNSAFVGPVIIRSGIMVPGIIGLIVISHEMKILIVLFSSPHPRSETPSVR